MDQNKKKKRNFLYFLPVIGIFILVFFFTAISTVFTIYVKYSSNKDNVEEKFNGNLQNYIFDGNQGILLLAINQVHEGKKIDSYFLKIFNPLTKEKKEIKLNDDFDNSYKAPYIIGEHNSELWVYNHDLTSYNPYKLQTINDPKKLSDKNLFLLETLKDKNTKYVFDKKTKDIIIVGKKNYLLNTDNLTATLYSENIDNNSDNVDINNQYQPLEFSKSSEIKLSGNKYKMLFIRKKSKNNITEETKIKTNLSFINGKFLYDTTDKRIVEMNNPDGVVVIHNDPNTNNGKDFTISSIELSGKRDWIMFQSDIGIPNNDTENVSIDKAHLSKNQLIFITKNPGYAFALDAKNGSILWKY